MERAADILARQFVCARCHHAGGKVQELSMSGTGLSRMFDVQPYRYVFASCTNCGYTEVFNLDILQGRDDLGNFLDILFSG